MRVCFPFVGDTVGGSHISSALLIAAFSGSEVEPLACLHRKGPLEDFLAQRRLCFERFPDVRLVKSDPIAAQLATMLRAAVPLARFLRDRQITIVHTNDARMHLTWGLAARLAGVRFVWHQRTPEDSRRLGIYSCLASAIITISDHCRSALPPAMSRRAHVIENPFDTSTLLVDRATARNALLAELKAPDNAVIVGFVGNLIDRKRPLVFVEAAAQLRDRLGDRLYFPMFGDPRPALSNTVQRHIETLGLSGHCTLMGPRFPIEPCIAGCNLLLAPAINEGFGRTLIEAMLVGTPVVATDCGGHREIIEHERNGLLVAPDSADAFANAAASLLADPVRATAMSAAAWTAAKDRFSTARHAAAVLAVYRGLAR